MLDYSLLTKYGKVLDTDNVLPEHPRPDLKRDSFLNLNGKWDYTIVEERTNACVSKGEIVVPFPIESVLSGVGKTLEAHQVLCLTKSFSLDETFIKSTTLLHIGAVDQVAYVYVNGELAGSHFGGYTEAVFDISKYIHSGENSLYIRVLDKCSYLYPTGKQRKKRGGIWYTPISGIWQTVYIESVEPNYIKKIKAVPDIESSVISLTFDSESDRFDICVTYGVKTVFRGVTDKKQIEIPIPHDDLHLWSPEEPCLYDLTVNTGDDTVMSYFAMRRFETKNGYFCLNGKPYFVNGLLDQGYYSDGIYTPASYDSFKDDIMRMKALGFNTLRKHIKIEPMMFYYYCDKLGMLVFQDMVNVGKYSFFKDTVLPFSGLFKKRPYINVNREQRKVFTDTALYTVDRLCSIPSVVCYTIFNEGWGQFDGDGLYELLRKADGTRVYDSTSGWFHEKRSDVVSDHIYFKPIKPRKLTDTERPWIVSEFGGYSHSIKGHVFNTDKEFGYKKFDDLESFANAFFELYENEIAECISHRLAGAVYTQLSDVEDETNGILTYDREICKLPTDRTREVMEALFQRFNEVTTK